MLGRFMVLAAAVILTINTSAKETYNLNAGWTFFPSSATHTDNATVVNLPHTWNVVNDTRGEANYLKTIEISAAWRGKRVFLRIDGAATVADVFVDSRHVASHSGGSSAFVTELTDYLHFGSSAALRIVVNNSPRLDVLPTAGAENIYGGLFRGVEIIVCDPFSLSPEGGVRIETNHVSREKVEGEVLLNLLGTDSLPTTARIRFLDAGGEEVLKTSATVSDRNMMLPFALKKPHLWQGTDDPHLYDVEVTLARPDGSLTDSLVMRTGFRTVTVSSENKFLLNDRPVPIRGVIVHRDRAMVGSALTPFQIEEDVSLIREMGANAVRVAGGQHADYFYDLCDEAGILVWNDLAFTGAAYPTDLDFVDTQAFKNNGKQQLTEMVTQLHSHPSVVVWGLFSNVLVRPDNNPTTYISELNSLAHSLDDQRLTGGSSVQNGNINTITNLISFDLPFGWESGPPDGVRVWLSQLRNGFSHLNAGISYSAGGSIFQHSETLQKPDIQSTMHPEGWQTFFHEQYLTLAASAPELWGVFVGNMFDFGSWRYSDGDGRGIDDHGLVTFDRKDRKDAFWVYKAAWNNSEKFVHIAGGRLDTRTERRQTVKVYSNLPEVELFVGGRSVGKHTGKNGIFEWEDVPLRSGINRLEARADGHVDRISVTIK